MDARGARTSLLAIVGPTASGKSELAMQLAQEFAGEIICADSRTIYKGMDIGTAKPTLADQKIIKHWGLDVVEPGQPYSAANFKALASQAINDIQKRGQLAILAGGTGLYIDSIIYDFGFGSKADQKQRQVLEATSTEALQMAIKNAGYPMPKNAQNRRHLIRVLEREGQPGTKQTDLPAEVMLIGLLPADDMIRQRINLRAEAMFESGIVEETKKLLDRYGRDDLEATGGIAYKICLGLLAGEYDKPRAIELFKIADWQYARRQKTWFRRNPHIKWFDNLADAYSFSRGHLTAEAA